MFTPTDGNYYTITGNVGGTAGVGATVQLCSHKGSGAGTGYNVDVFQSYVADASGNFTFTVPDHRFYSVTAIPTGAFVCRVSHDVYVSGANVTGVNFQINALNSSNNPTIPTF